MNPSYIGVVWQFAGNFAPVGFNYCDGSLQSIAENSTLFTLLGTTYGGDGVQTFGLPDLRGRMVIGQGTGTSLPTYINGQKSGTESVTLTTAQMAGHTHLLYAGPSANSQTPTSSSYINQVNNNGTATNFFSDQPANAQLIGGSISAAGSSIPIEIVQPVLAISYVIALYGIYPSQG